MKKVLLMLFLLCAVLQGAWAQRGVTITTYALNTLPTDGDGNYFINDENDRVDFCVNVENGDNYSGKSVKLMADDLSVSTMVGTSAQARLSASERERAQGRD